MSLFNFSKKEEEIKASFCNCSTVLSATETTDGCCGKNKSSIKVLGSGCRNCHDLFEASMVTVSNMGLDIDVEYVTDMEKIMEYGVMSMPALVVNEHVVSMGKVLKAADVEKVLRKQGF